jgi:hypothetical protein
MALLFNNAFERIEQAMEEAQFHFKYLKESVNKTQEKTHWTMFLTAIDIVRKELFANYKSLKDHNKWFSKFSCDMKQDSLLRYMRNARNNMQHMTTKSPIDNKISFNFKDIKGKKFSFEEISITLIDGVLSISIEAENLPKGFELDFNMFEQDGEALTVINDGKEYFPPRTHLDSKLTSRKLTYLAEVALDYYDSVLMQVRAASQKVNT